METSLDAPLVQPATASADWPFIPLAAFAGGLWAASAWNPACWPFYVGGWALLLGGWVPLWRVLTATDWAASLLSWRDWRCDTRGAEIAPWPYLQPYSPGARLRHALSWGYAWWQAHGRAQLTPTLQTALLSASVSLLIAAMLGRSALLLTLLLIAWAELAVLWNDGGGAVGVPWYAVAGVGLPWLLGTLLGGVAPLAALRDALAVAVMAAGFISPTLLAFGGPMALAGLLIWQGHDGAASLLLLLALPGWLALSARPAAEAYRRAVAPWLLLMLFVVAGVW